MRDAAEEVFNVDGKLLRTLKLLFLRPSVGKPVPGGLIRAVSWGPRLWLGLGGTRGLARRRSAHGVRLREELPGLDAKANSRIKYLFIACGTADGLVGVNRQFKEWLKAKNVRFTEEEAPEVGHVWPLWRQNLSDFVHKTFK